MDLPTLNNFTMSRDLCIAYLSRHTSTSIKLILETQPENILWHGTELLYQDQVLSPIPDYWLDYWELRQNLFPNAHHLFTTVAGTQLYPDKFHRHFRALLASHSVDGSFGNPRKLTQQQFNTILKSYLEIRRQRYQAVLALAFCAYLGMRPSEIAKLLVSDIDFDTDLLSLRDTKSQEDQVMPLLPFFIAPLKRYISYIPDARAPLFTNANQTQWDRTDVTKSIKEWGMQKDIPNITPRRLRASLGAMLSRQNVSPSLIATILRHKDPATALRHYNQRELAEARAALLKCGMDKTPLSDSEIRKYERQFEGDE